MIERGDKCENVRRENRLPCSGRKSDGINNGNHHVAAARRAEARRVDGGLVQDLGRCSGVGVCSE